MIRAASSFRNQPAPAGLPSGHGVSLRESVPVEACLRAEQPSHGVLLASDERIDAALACAQPRKERLMIAWADAINGAFEAVGAVFTVWGVWNLAYYPALGQWLSFVGGVVLVAGNLAWVVEAVKSKSTTS